MDYEGRRARLSGRLDELEADAFLVTRLPNVRYLTGFTGSNGQLLLGKQEAVFLTDGRYAEQSRREVAGIRRLFYTLDFPSAFAKACAEQGLAGVAFEAAGISYKLYEELTAAPVQLIPTTREVERLRWVKDAAERERLRAAQAIADHAFDQVCESLSEGASEKQVALRLDVAVQTMGAEGIAFDTIVAFGESAAEPHHRPTDRTLSRGNVVKMDFGCVVGGYHSDMTRTVALGEPSAEMREVYEAVRRAQQAGIDAVRAGIVAGEADRASRDVIALAGYASHFTHSLGHGVGLEIHEGPTLRGGSDDIVPEGAVVTVEPGIYVAGKGGVRIEDMVEVTAGGCRVIPVSTKDLLVL